MTFCSNCGTSVAEGTAFCPNCGTSLKPFGAAPDPAMHMHSSTVVQLVQPEQKDRRVLAYLIDIVPMLVLAIVHFIPILGWMFYGLLHALYWLLRDINGASPGKSVMGSYVGTESGSVSTNQQRILRNVPLAIPGLLGMIPLLGLPIEFFAALAIFGLEAILLLTTGRRLGDRLAGTNVFRR